MRQHKVITPEQVEIVYRLAEMPTRVMASGIDLILQFIGFALLILTNLGIAQYAPTWYGEYYGWCIGISILLSMAILFAFSMFYEYRDHGQTPGKRIMGIRVMRLNGEPAGMTHVAIRNLFKYIIDMLGIGLWFMLFNKKCRRIGDLVGGTIVIYTTLGDFIKPQAQWQHLTSLRMYYDEATINLILVYRQRRDHFIDPQYAESIILELKDLMLKQQATDRVNEHINLILAP